MPAVLGLVTKAATWLAPRSSAQWQHPIEKLHRGIARDIARGEVWVVEDDPGTAIATITITTTQTRVLDLDDHPDDASTHAAWS